MPRYRKRPSSWIEDEDTWDQPPLLPRIEAAENNATFTGLLDENGDEIWREPNPMGFGRDDEW